MSDRRRYFKVGPTLWTDHPAWGDDERLLALYVLTCPHRATEGLYRLPCAYIGADLGWQEKRVRRALDALTRDDFIEYDYDAGVILIVSALKWQKPMNDNGVTAALKALETVPPTRLAARFRGLAEELADRLWQALPQGLPQPLTQPLTHPPAPTSSSTNSGGSTNVVELPRDVEAHLGGAA